MTKNNNSDWGVMVLPNNRRVLCRYFFAIAFTFTAFFAHDSSVYAADPYEGFPEPQSNFQSHVAEVEQYLLATQLSQRQASDVQYNLPFEKKANKSVPYRGKFLLIHGLNDSPYVFTDVAAELTVRGFDVRAVLLPGHGNTPEAQLNMSYKRWLNAAREHLQYWQSDEKEPMYLGGFSMGAVIATMLALEHGNIDGLLLFSPAFQSSKNHLLRWSGLYSRFKPWVFGGMIREDNPTKYNSIPINGVAQYYALTKRLKRKWAGKQLNMPVLAVASANDSVVDIDYLVKAFTKRFSSDKKRLLIYSNNDSQIGVNAVANATTEPSAHGNPIVYRRSAYPDRRILNQSHQSVLMSPANPLFGENGSVLVCNGNDWPTFSACLFSRQQHWYGAQHTPSPDGVPVARTTYNADFAEMFLQFDQLFNE